MNNAFKPLGLAAAVAAASAGVANAQTYGTNDLGDVALVPYYTVAGDWVTGIHIVNTSADTQVVKLRFRRASDSLDALDFNIVMSPKDVYAGFLSKNDDGDVVWAAQDTTCTVPATADGVLPMPAIYNPEGTGLGESGYVEVFAMASPMNESMPIAIAAKHVDGTPRSCAAVRSNFFANGSTADEVNGIVTNEESYQIDPGNGTGMTGQNLYTDSGDVLKVSYFIRDNASGLEFGDNAVHIEDFLTQPSMTNQEFGWLSGDLRGFDFPDLDGGTPIAATPERGRFDGLRAVLGAQFLVNEWSVNPDNGVALDWVVTLPGQYTMLDTPQYVISLLADNDTDKQIGFPLDVIFIADGECDRGTCDYRDIPVTALINNYDREEDFPRAPGPRPGELVVSPNVPDAEAPVPVTQLTKEVNVVTFGDASVLGTSDINVADPGVPQPFGWLNLSVRSADDDLRVCQWDPSQDSAGGPFLEDAEDYLALMDECVPVTNPGVPIIGFAAWARSVAANPDASYGRIIEHSYASQL